MACNLPCKLYNYIIFERRGIFSISFILLGSNSIPCPNIIKPNNFPEVTLEIHFFGFNITLCSNNLSNILVSTLGFSYQVLYLAKKLST